MNSVALKHVNKGLNVDKIPDSPPNSRDGNNWTEVDDLRPIEEIPHPYQQIFAEYPGFNVIQSKVFDDVLYADKSLVISAPTGSGKTAIFELAIVRLLISSESSPITTNFKIVYISPMKALCEERLIDWYSKFSDFGISTISVTGDSDNGDFQDIFSHNLIITTPEKWDCLTRKWKDNKKLVQLIKLFMIDEVHLLNEDCRGSVLEIIVCRMKTIQESINYDKEVDVNHKIRFIATSATISNIGDMAEWFGKPSDVKYYKFSEEMRPVKLQKIVLGYPYGPQSTPFKFDIALNYKLQPLIMQYSGGKPTLIFCSTRKIVEMTAKHILQNLTISLKADQKQRLIQVAETITDVKVRGSIIHGVGYHHAGMLPETRHAVENLFRNSQLPILVTTSTLAMGVNLPAHLVIIKSTKCYANGGFRDYTETALLQMIGRAGRPQFDTRATALILTTDKDKVKFEKMVGGLEPIESNLHKHLTEHVNAEVVLETITDLDVAMRWLSSTFLYIRARKNPRYYGLSPELSLEQIDRRLLEMCKIDLNRLVKGGMLMIDENTVLKSTPIGVLMAKYYLAFETMKLFTQINGDEILQQILHLISKCHEFSEMYLRVNDKKCLNLLNKCRNGQTIRFPLNGKIKSIEMKINCIIQAVLGCLNICDHSILSETLKIMRNGERIVKCLIEYLEQKDKCFRALFNTIILAKCFKAKLWENSPYVSKQLNGIGPVMSSQLVNAGKTSFQLIAECDPREIELIINKRSPMGDKILDQIQHLPKYSVKLERDGEEKFLLTISLLNHSHLQNNSTISLNGVMYLVVGDSLNNIILYEKYTHSYMVENPNVVKNITVKSMGLEDIEAHFISEDWVGIDSSTTFDFPNKKSVKETGVKTKQTSKAQPKTSKVAKDKENITYMQKFMELYAKTKKNVKSKKSNDYNNFSVDGAEANQDKAVEDTNKNRKIVIHSDIILGSSHNANSNKIDKIPDENVCEISEIQHQDANADQADVVKTDPKKLTQNLETSNSNSENHTEEKMKINKKHEKISYEFSDNFGISDVDWESIEDDDLLENVDGGKLNQCKDKDNEEYKEAELLNSGKEELEMSEIDWENIEKDDLLVDVEGKLLKEDKIRICENHKEPELTSEKMEKIEANKILNKFKYSQDKKLARCNKSESPINHIVMESSNPQKKMKYDDKQKNSTKIITWRSPLIYSPPLKFSPNINHKVLNNTKTETSHNISLECYATSSTSTNTTEEPDMKQTNASTFFNTSSILNKSSSSKSTTFFPISDQDCLESSTDESPNNRKVSEDLGDYVSTSFLEEVGLLPANQPTRNFSSSQIKSADYYSKLLSQTYSRNDKFASMEAKTPIKKDTTNLSHPTFLNESKNNSDIIKKELSDIPKLQENHSFSQGTQVNFQSDSLILDSKSDHDSSVGSKNTQYGNRKVPLIARPKEDENLKEVPSDQKTYVQENALNNNYFLNQSFEKNRTHLSDDFFKRSRDQPFSQDCYSKYQEYNDLRLARMKNYPNKKLNTNLFMADINDSGFREREPVDRNYSFNESRREQRFQPYSKREDFAKLVPNTQIFEQTVFSQPNSRRDVGRRDRKLNFTQGDSTRDQLTASSSYSFDSRRNDSFSEVRRTYRNPLINDGLDFKEAFIEKNSKSDRSRYSRIEPASGSSSYTDRLINDSGYPSSIFNKSNFGNENIFDEDYLENRQPQNYFQKNIVDDGIVNRMRHNYPISCNRRNYYSSSFPNQNFQRGFRNPEHPLQGFNNDDFINPDNNFRRYNTSIGPYSNDVIIKSESSDVVGEDQIKSHRCFNDNNLHRNSYENRNSQSYKENYPLKYESNRFDDLIPCYQHKREVGDDTAFMKYQIPQDFANHGAGKNAKVSAGNMFTFPLPYEDTHKLIFPLQQFIDRDLIHGPDSYLVEPNYSQPFNSTSPASQSPFPNTMDHRF